LLRLNIQSTRWERDTHGPEAGQCIIGQTRL
jgi:hypothetical protein